MEIDELKKYPVWYKNCKRQRKRGAKICQDCPFRKAIEKVELANKRFSKYNSSTEEKGNK